MLKVRTESTEISFDCVDVLNVFIDIPTSKELIQMDTNKMITYETLMLVLMLIDAHYLHIYHEARETFVVYCQDIYRSKSVRGTFVVYL